MEAINLPFPSWGIRMGLNKVAVSDKVGEGGSLAKALRSGAGTSYLAEAKDSGEEVRGRLSGHGFSTERREARRRMRSEFPRRGNERAEEPIPEPYTS